MNAIQGNKIGTWQGTVIHCDWSHFVTRFLSGGTIEPYLTANIPSE